MCYICKKMIFHILTNSDKLYKTNQLLQGKHKQTHKIVTDLLYLSTMPFHPTALNTTIKEGN